MIALSLPFVSQSCPTVLFVKMRYCHVEFVLLIVSLAAYGSPGGTSGVQRHMIVRDLSAAFRTSASVTESFRYFESVLESSPQRTLHQTNETLKGLSDGEAKEETTERKHGSDLVGSTPRYTAKIPSGERTLRTDRNKGFINSNLTSQETSVDNNSTKNSSEIGTNAYKETIQNLNISVGIISSIAHAIQTMMGHKTVSEESIIGESNALKLGVSEVITEGIVEHHEAKAPTIGMNGVSDPMQEIATKKPSEWTVYGNITTKEVNTKGIVEPHETKPHVAILIGISDPMQEIATKKPSEWPVYGKVTTTEVNTKGIVEPHEIKPHLATLIGISDPMQEIAAKKPSVWAVHRNVTTTEVNTKEIVKPHETKPQVATLIGIYDPIQKVEMNEPSYERTNLEEAIMVNKGLKYNGNVITTEVNTKRIVEPHEAKSHVAGLFGILRGTSEKSSDEITNTDKVITVKTNYLNNITMTNMNGRKNIEPPKTTFQISSAKKESIDNPNTVRYHLGEDDVLYSVSTEKTPEDEEIYRNRLPPVSPSPGLSIVSIHKKANGYAPLKSGREAPGRSDTMIIWAPKRHVPCPKGSRTVRIGYRTVCKRVWTRH